MPQAFCDELRKRGGVRRFSQWKVFVNSIRRIAVFVSVALLAACGGGGGGSGSNVSVPPPAQTNITQQSVQRSDAQSGLSGLNAYLSYAGGGSLSTYAATRTLVSGVKSKGRAWLTNLRRDGATGCEDGTVSGYTENSNGTVTFTIDDYYDSACDNIESSLVWTATISSNDEVFSGPATLINYSTSGAVTETTTATIEFIFNSSGDLTGFSILATSIVENNTSLGQAGIGCSVASATTVSCGVAAAANIAASSLEDGANVSMTATTSSAVSVSMQISTYQGGLNALSIASGTFPDWTVSPSSDLLGSVAISGTESPTSATVSLTLTDSTNDATLSMTGSIDGTVTGTLTNNANGATVASFSVNAQGNGTLTYGNGDTASIVDYIVQG